MYIRERQTHQHHSNRVSHDFHIGLQDVIVEGWGQHPTVLEPCWPIQQEQTIACEGYECVHECVNSEIKGKNGGNLVDINGGNLGKEIQESRIS